MKDIFKNKKVLFTIATALILGGLTGWIIKPSGEQSQNPLVHEHSSEEEVWTCSMHPQIRQSEPGSCPLCGMDLILATSGSSSEFSSPFVHEMTPEAVAMANIHTSRVSGISTEGELLLSGKIQRDERQLASITAKYEGRIESLFVNFTGQMVQKGQPLATIYSPELVRAQQELLVAASSKEVFPQLYEAAREKLRLWKLSELQIDQIETTGELKENFEVLATESGVVSQRHIAVGDYVSTGTVLFSIVDLSRLWVMLDAYESDLPLVKVGDEVKFTVRAVPGKEFKARITFIDPVIDPDTRTASVRAETRNPNMKLKPGMFVTAGVQSNLETTGQSLAIPRTALLWSGTQSIVYVKVPQSEFPAYEMREITIGPLMGEMYVVEAGLEAGEEIVSNGVFAVDAAAQLSGNYSMMMRPETKTIEVPTIFREQITEVADAYFNLKNALVEDDINEAGKAVKQVTTAMEKVDMTQLDGKAHDHWMMLKAQLGDAAARMAGTDDINSLRVHFELLSEAMIETTESFGLEKDKVYKEYCPMAFDNEGGYWLSEIGDIRNPYFGDAMLNCGEIVETYLKGQKVFEQEATAHSSSAEGHHH